MAIKPAKDSSERQSDLLLWVAGGAVAAVGAAWLFILHPWASGPEPEVAAAAAPLRLATAAGLPDDASVANGDGAATPSGTEPAVAADDDVGLDNPLRMAQLAYDAGMLIEPESYSAWTLYSRVIKAEPNNAEAQAGINRVADDLVRRGETALDQGRFDDARVAVERIRAVLPKHPGAKLLADKIWPATVATATASATTPAFKPTLQVQEAPKVAPVQVVPEAPARPKVDPIAEANEAFGRAMSESRLLTPAEQSAKHYVDVLVAESPKHEITRNARLRLSSEFLSRATQALEAHDTEAARIWIDEAESIGIDPAGVRTARTTLTDQLIALESAKRVPASTLKVTNYVAPAYPTRALQNQLQGWVDVEFTVTTDGSTSDVTITGASSDMFRREAITAVAKWRFEPRVFMNRTIAQRSFTRIKFVQ